jgi:hypothetical protein
MYPGLPSRLEKEIKNLYLERVLKGDKAALQKFKVNIIISFYYLILWWILILFYSAVLKILQEESTWYSWEVLYWQKL